MHYWPLLLKFYLFFLLLWSLLRLILYYIFLLSINMIIMLNFAWTISVIEDLIFFVKFCLKWTEVIVLYTFSSTWYYFSSTVLYGYSALNFVFHIKKKIFQNMYGNKNYVPLGGSNLLNILVQLNRYISSVCYRYISNVC